MIAHEPISGASGEVGTKSRVVFQMGQQKVECIDTVTRREPADLGQIPKEFLVQFDREIVGEGIWSVVRDRFTETGPEMTLWESESEYRFSGLLMRLEGLLMPRSFRKQSEGHMQDFKAFAGQGTDVRDAA